MAAAEEKNPFDLAQRDGPNRHQPARVWTPEEQAAKLDGYMEVDPEFWDQIRYGTHMRYFLKTGEFRTGGFVLKNPFDATPANETREMRYLKLQSTFDAKAPGYMQWMVAYEKVGRIFIKPDAGALMMMRNLEKAVEKINTNSRKLAEVAKQHEAKIAQIVDHAKKQDAAIAALRR
jgi:hypothetical protein